MPQHKRVLFVDDEPEIRTMWSTILKSADFEVKDAASVAEALSLITTEKFDALIADLNIGQPGDGFTIVSAMRRLHPDSVTLIMTGYPAFQAALRAIHEQVDDFLVKPADPEQVLHSVRSNLIRRRKHVPAVTHRLFRVIADHKQEIIDEWYRAVEKDSYMRTIPLSREERIDHLPAVLDEVIRPDNQVQPHAWDAAAEHGVTRRKQGYTVPMMLQETRILRNVIAQCTQRNLLLVDISNLIPDLVSVEDTIHLMLRHSAEAFLASRTNAA